MGRSFLWVLCFLTMMTSGPRSVSLGFMIWTWLAWLSRRAEMMVSLSTESLSLPGQSARCGERLDCFFSFGVVICSSFLWI